MKQLTATNHMNGMKIVQRYIDGVRYLKVTPSNFVPAIFQNLKQQFDGKSIDIEKSETDWIKIIKKEKDEQLEKAAKTAVGKSEIDEDYVLNKEAEMLRSQGFVVKVEEIE